MTQYIVFTADVQTAQAAKLRDAITKAANAGNEIYLIISSGGGNVFEGMSIAALLKTLPVKIITHNVGQTDSIANVIFATGSTRYATKNSSFLFHGVRMSYQNQVFIESQLEEQYKIIKRLRSDIAAAFSAYSGLKIADVEALMISGSTILTATEALGKSIINEIRDANIPVGSQIISIGNA
jgi:ATP-dependent protease ClpP protease subunit